MPEYCVIKLPDELEVSSEDGIDPGNTWDRMLEGTASLTLITIRAVAEEEGKGPIDAREQSIALAAAYAAVGYGLLMMKKEGLLKDLGEDSTAWDAAL